MQTIAAVSDPCWADPAHSSILCQVTTKEEGGPHPFTCMASDPEPHGQQLWHDLKTGKYGPIGDYVLPTVPRTIGKKTSATVADPPA